MTLQCYFLFCTSLKPHFLFLRSYFLPLHLPPFPIFYTIFIVSYSYCVSCAPFSTTPFPSTLVPFPSLSLPVFSTSFHFLCILLLLLQFLLPMVHSRLLYTTSVYCMYYFFSFNSIALPSPYLSFPISSLHFPVHPS